MKCEHCGQGLQEWREQRVGFCLTCIRAMAIEDFAVLVLGVPADKVPI